MEVSYIFSSDTFREKFDRSENGAHTNQLLKSLKLSLAINIVNKHGMRCVYLIQMEGKMR